MFLLFGKVHIFENFLQFYQYLVIDDGNPSDCNSLVKSIRKTSTFSIYFIYIKQHFFKKIFRSRFCTDLLQFTTLSKNSSQKYTQVILNMFGAQHFNNNNKKTNRFTAYYQIFFINIFIYIKVDHCGYKKICMSWE